MALSEYKIAVGFENIPKALELYRELQLSVREKKNIHYERVGEFLSYLEDFNDFHWKKKSKEATKKSKKAIIQLLRARHKKDKLKYELLKEYLEDFYTMTFHDYSDHIESSYNSKRNCFEFVYSQICTKEFSKYTGKVLGKYNRAAIIGVFLHVEGYRIYSKTKDIPPNSKIYNSLRRWMKKEKRR